MTKLAEKLAELAKKPLPEPEWPEFIPLDEAGVLPPFPMETLPRWIGDYAAAVAASTRFSPDMAAGFGLGALSAAVGSCFEVIPAPGWQEPSNLFLAIVAEPSEGKSPIFKRMMAPIFAIDAELEAKHKIRFAVDTEKRKALENRVRKAREAHEREPENKVLEKTFEDLAAEMATPIKAIPRLAVQDVTGETLGRVLQEQNERIALLSPEDTMWAHIGGRYSDSPSVEIYLSAYSCEEVRVDRAARSVVLRKPALTVCVAMQPSVLMGHGSKLADQRGLLARFLYLSPPRLVGSRDHSTDPPAIPDELTAQYVFNLSELAKVNVVACRERQQMHLSTSAKAEWRAWQCKLELRRRDDGDLYAIRGWAGKAEGFALRLAGLLAIADGYITVEVDHLRRAFVLVEYFAAHAKVSIGIALADDTVRNAARLLGWIQRRVRRAAESTPPSTESTPPCWFKTRDAWKGNKSWLTAITAQDAVGLLKDAGYIRNREVGKSHWWEPNLTRCAVG